jgi:EndoU nuclease-like protein
VKRSLPLALVAALSLAELLEPDSPALASHWTSTRPAVNEAHLFEGEVNRRGKPVGFHSRPGGRDPRGARVVRVVDGPNHAGVYVAEVEIRDPESGRWLRKRSTLYPDAMRREQVIAAVLNAWEHRTTGGSERFRGPSGRGFTIEGYLLPDGDDRRERRERRDDRVRINTAWPIFREDR